MSKKVRDYLLIVFVILFVFITVVTSLYASGYKFNLSWPPKFNRLLQKTGMLAVATNPERAVIYLNDKPQKDLSIKPWRNDYLLTPTKIKNILPGEYELRLEQNGYWPYKQKIWINSGETTFVEDVNLFRENLPLLVLSTPLSDLNLSLDKKYLYASAAKKIITLKTELTRDLNLSGNTSGTWLKNNRLLVGGLIFDPQKTQNDTNYTNLIGTGVTNWYFEEATSRLYYQNNNSINRLDTNSLTNTLIISGDNYLAYEPRQEKIFVIVSSNNQTQLRAYSIKNNQLLETSTLPTSGHYLFVHDILNYLAIYDDQNKTLYLYSETNLNNGPTIIRNIKNWAVYSNESLIYTNDFEIYVFNYANNRVDLITRRSEVINKIIWSASGNYLLFSSPTTLNVLDFKNRNATLLFRAEKIASPVLDEKNNNLYFWAQVGQQEGVYKMLMQ